MILPPPTYHINTINKIDTKFRHLSFDGYLVQKLVMNQYIHGNFIIDQEVEQYVQTHYNYILSVAKKRVQLREPEFSEDDAELTRRATVKVLELKERLNLIRKERAATERRRQRSDGGNPTSNILRIEKQLHCVKKTSFLKKWQDDGRDNLWKFCLHKTIDERTQIITKKQS